MCIIVSKQIGVEMPSVETLKECFLSNPDGAGFMYANGKVVKIRKGFMDFASFMNALDKEIPEEKRKDTAIVMHFRIATSGKVQPACCHPFPVSDEKEKLQATEMDSRWGIAHNGVINGRTTYDGWSDTMDFVADVVAPLSRMHPSFMYSDDARDLLAGACMSKLAIMDNAGDIMLVGHFEEADGVNYSNTSYLKTTYNWSSYRSWWDRRWGDALELDADYEVAEPKENTTAFGDMDTLLDDLKFMACQVCPDCYECAEMGEWCGTERQAIETCADSNGVLPVDIAELLEVSLDELNDSEWDEEEEWAKVYNV